MCVVCLRACGMSKASNTEGLRHVGSYEVRLSWFLMYGIPLIHLSTFLMHGDVQFAGGPFQWFRKVGPSGDQKEGPGVQEQESAAFLAGLDAEVLARVEAAFLAGRPHLGYHDGPHGSLSSRSRHMLRGPAGFLSHPVTPAIRDILPMWGSTQESTAEEKAPTETSSAGWELLSVPSVRSVDGSVGMDTEEGHAADEGEGREGPAEALGNQWPEAKVRRS